MSHDLHLDLVESDATRLIAKMEPVVIAPTTNFMVGASFPPDPRFHPRVKQMPPIKTRFEDLQKELDAPSLLQTTSRSTWCCTALNAQLTHSALSHSSTRTRARVRTTRSFIKSWSGPSAFTSRLTSRMERSGHVNSDQLSCLHLRTHAAWSSAAVYTSCPRTRQKSSKGEFWRASVEQDSPECKTPSQVQICGTSRRGLLLL